MDQLRLLYGIQCCMRQRRRLVIEPFTKTERDSTVNDAKSSKGKSPPDIRDRQTVSVSGSLVEKTPEPKPGYAPMPQLIRRNLVLAQVFKWLGLLHYIRNWSDWMPKNSVQQELEELMREYRNRPVLNGE